MRVFSNLRVFEKFEIDFMGGIRDRFRRKSLRTICSVVVSVAVVAAVQIPSGRGEEFTSRHVLVFERRYCARFSPKARFSLLKKYNPK